MSYYFNKIVDMSFDEAIKQVTEELKKEGFGVLTEIDVKEALKKKLNVDFRKYRILGACNPQYAYKALQTEDKIGTMLPCNVIIQEREELNTKGKKRGAAPDKTAVAAIPISLTPSFLNDSKKPGPAWMPTEYMKNISPIF